MLGMLRAEIERLGGWMGFDRYMNFALYSPGLGYYARGSDQFGNFARAPGNLPAPVGSDFVTAPEMSGLFGRALARQVSQALDATGSDEVWEFGAGTGALARQLLEALGPRIRRYTIVDISDSLRERQQRTLQPYADRLEWARTLPQRMRGVVLGNEVLDAMPVQLLARKGGVWHERGVVWEDAGGPGWQDRVTALRAPLEIAGDADYLTEIHCQAEAFVATLADHLECGAIFLLDYGFPESEYYHPQRSMGTVMCHRAHRSDMDPLSDPGDKDITAHVNFTGVALAGQQAGLEVLGYTSQAHFLINCGLVQDMEQSDLPQRVAAQKLIMEHEMGELFKVIGLGKGAAWQAMGFARGDRTHRL
jgi:SAM-dependent MidA family methyltransferase